MVQFPDRSLSVGLLLRLADSRFFLSGPSQLTAHGRSDLCQWDTDPLAASMACRSAPKKTRRIPLIPLQPAAPRLIISGND